MFRIRVGHETLAAPVRAHRGRLALPP